LVQTNNPADPSGEVKLTWLGQAGLVLQYGANRLVIDPFIAPHPGRAIAPPDPETIPIDQVSAVLCTHEHDDHLHFPSLRLIRQASPGCTIMVPAPLVDAVTQVLGGPVQAAVIGQTDGIGQATITPMPACHAVNVADGMSSDGGRFVGYVVRLGGQTIYHAGDTLTWEGQAATLRRLNVNTACLPINGRDAEREAANIVGNMNAAEAVALCLEARAEHLIPIHWDMFSINLGDPAEAVRLGQASGLTVTVPVRYQPITLPTTSGTATT
jgi:L-ascorbate metabolism protein UlaG (beta-lactamase superfamily)